MVSSVIQLKCYCKNDPWGKKGRGSCAARYAATAPGTDFQIDEDQDYSEMWMGTYPSNPAFVLESGEELQKVLNANSEALIGKPVIEKFGTDLPFIPKILSIQKALPLQIHPDKELAAKLHEKDPEKIGDTNHKPEIAVALTAFEGFVGWKPLADIKSFFLGFDVLQRRFFPDTTVEFNEKTLKELVLRILSTSDTHIQETVAELMRVRREEFGKHAYIADLLPRLAKQYSKADPGTIVALFTMNYMVLQPGESTYIPADGIHAYLYGDIIECMARSDNMLAAGFCPRVEMDDLDLFTEALTFSPRSPDEAMLQSTPFDRAANRKTRVYAPPLSEFQVIGTDLADSESEVIQPIHGPSILVVTGGEGKIITENETKELKEGYVFFIGCGVEVRYETDKGLQVYRAFCEV